MNSSTLLRTAMLAALALGANDTHLPGNIRVVRPDAGPAEPEPAERAPKPMKYPFQHEQHLQGAWYGDGVEPTKVTRQMRRMQERQSKR